MTAARALTVLRRVLPYTVRAEGAAGSLKVPHAELLEARVALPDGPTTARRVLSAVVAALPSGWQATLLAGRVILYKELGEYEAGKVIARH